jgi:hypothetical protein
MAKRSTKRSKKPKELATLVHDEEKRRNVPTAEYQTMLEKQARDPVRVEYERRKRDLDAQLVGAWNSGLRARSNARRRITVIDAAHKDVIGRTLFFPTGS